MENNNPNISEAQQNVAKSTSKNTNPSIAKVQHVAKSSSDQLLRKFAEVGSGAEDKISAKKELRLAKRVKISQTGASKYSSKSYGESNTADSGNPSSSLADRKLLLPPVAASRKSVALIRRFGICKTKIRAKELKTKSIITAIEKTWRRTLEGASRVVLMEKHYNKHKRLINDA